MEDFEWITDTMPITVGLQFYWTLYDNDDSYDYSCVYTITDIDYGDGSLIFVWDDGSSNEYTVDDIIRYIDEKTIKVK